MTNSDKIRSMTDEELAEFLASLMPQSCDSCEADRRPDFHCHLDCNEAWGKWVREEVLKGMGNTLPTVDVTSDVDTEEVLAEVPKSELEKLVDLIKERHPDWDIEEAWDGVFLTGKNGRIACHVAKHWKGDMLEGFDYTRMHNVTGTMTAEEALRWMEEIDLKGDGISLEEKG